MTFLSRMCLFVCLVASGAIAGCGSGSSGTGGGSGGTNPTPSITSISPTSAPQAGQTFTLTVSGSGFVPGSQVEWGQTALATTYGSAASVTAQVPSSDLANQGTFSITVTSPAPGGGTSGAVTFTVGNPMPVVSAIQPSSALAGSAAVTLNVSGSAFLPTSQVQWNGSALTTTYLTATALSAQVPPSDLAGSATNISANVTVVNPSPAGGTSAPAQFEVLAPLTYVRKIDLPANDIVWDGTHGKLYASLPSTDKNGNSVVAIDPVSAAIGTPQPVGKEPDPLALSDDNSFLYVGQDGTGTVTRLNLPALTVDAGFGIQFPSDPTLGQQGAITLAVAPGNPHTLAVRIGGFSSPANTAGVAVYDDSTQRPNVIPSFPRQDMQDLQWGADASVLYGSSDNSDGDFRVMSVDATGITQLSTYPNLDPVFGNLHFDRASGLAYIDGGWVIDPVHASVAGTFNLAPMISVFNTWPFTYASMSPLCVVDSDRGVVFFLGQTEGQLQAKSGFTLAAFDAKTYRLLGTLPISGPTGYPNRFIRWGTSGLAFTTGVNPSVQFFPGGGPIYLIDGAFVNPAQPAAAAAGAATYPFPVLSSISPQGAAMGSPSFTMTVKGSNFFPSSTVTWNDVPLPTTFVSSTELTAQVIGGNLTNPGNVKIAVNDSVTLHGSVTSLAFTIIPPGTGTTTIVPLNLAGCDVGWDSKSQQLIVPVLSVDTQYPNTVIGVDPAIGAVVHSAQVAADPCAFSVTGDGSYVYTGFGNVGSMTRLSLPNLDDPMSWFLPSDPQGGPTLVSDLKAVPGEAHTWAADLISSSLYGGVVVYDDGVARSDLGPAGGYLEWGGSDTVLYASDPSTANWFLTVFDVNGSGAAVVQQSQIPGSAPTAGTRVHYDSATGYLYQDSGDVYDPANGKAVGSYSGSGFVAVDTGMNRVFILGQVAPGSYAIESYNKSTFARVGFMGLPSLVGVPVAFTRWGDHGLAFVTSNGSSEVDAIAGTVPPAGMLYILSDTSFVSANAVPAAGVQEMPPVHSFPRPQAFSALPRR